MNVCIPQKARNLTANYKNINFKDNIHEIRSVILEKNFKKRYDLLITKTNKKQTNPVA
jgi:hypothetical protein